MSGKRTYKNIIASDDFYQKIGFFYHSKKKNGYKELERAS